MVLAATLLAGCWDRHEIERLAIVAGIGLDLQPDGSLLLVTQIVKPALVKAPGQGGIGSPRAVSLVSSTGTTVAGATRALAQVAGRRPFWGHARVLVVGEELARAGLADVMDWFFRQREPRPRTRVLVARGRAADLLAAESELEKLPAAALDNTLELQSATTLAPDTSLHRFLRDLTTPGKDPLVAAAAVVSRTAQAGFLEMEARPPEAQEPATEKEQEPRRFDVRGSAVFKGDRLVGWMDEEETRATLWVAGAGRRATVVIPGPPGSGQDSTVEVLGVGSKVKAHEEGDRLVLTVSLECRAALSEEPRGPDVTVGATLEDVGRRLESVLAADIAAAFRTAQSLRADPFGFGFTLCARQPELWKRYEGSWPDALASAEIRVSVKASIVRSGLSLKAPR
ncbi:MAG TPA: hypothetical protein DGR79_04635 [Clostridiales bacterium]|nr:hypothetical protein [Clostridiales bacterium]